MQREFDEKRPQTPALAPTPPRRISGMEIIMGPNFVSPSPHLVYFPHPDDPLHLPPPLDLDSGSFASGQIPSPVSILCDAKQSYGDWKQMCEKLIHIATDFKSASDLCAKTRQDLSQASDTEKQVKHWASMQVHFLQTQMAASRGHGTWLRQQQWEHWQNEAAALHVNERLLPIFQEEFADLCREAAKPYDIRDSKIAAAALMEVASAQMVSFRQCVDSFPKQAGSTRPQPYLKQIGRKQDVKRIKEKTEKYGGPYLKDMNRARLYFETAKAAVEALRAIHGFQSQDECASDPTSFVILQIKPNLLSPLRNINVVVGIRGSHTVIGEVQFVVAPYEDTMMEAKLHFLYEIERACVDEKHDESNGSAHEGKREMSSALKQEICAGLDKLWLFFAEMQRPEQVSPDQAEANFCHKLCNMINNVPIAKIMFSELNTWLNEIRETLTLAAKNGTPYNGEQLSDALLGAQRIIVQASTQNLVQLFQAFALEIPVSSFLYKIGETTANLAAAHHALNLREIDERKGQDEAEDFQSIQRLLEFQNEVQRLGPSQDKYIYKPVVADLIALQQLWGHEFRVSWERELAEFPPNDQGKVALLQEKTRKLILNAANLVSGLVKNQLIPSSHMILQHLEEDKARLERLRFKLVVVGSTNAGKSTLINALVGHPLLPERALPMTMFPICVKHDPKIPKAVLHIDKDALSPFQQSIEWIKCLGTAMGLGVPLDFGEGDVESDAPEIIQSLHQVRSLFKREIAEYLHSNRHESKEGLGSRLVTFINQKAESECVAVGCDQEMKRYNDLAQAANSLAPHADDTRHLRAECEKRAKLHQRHTVAAEWDQKMSHIEGKLAVLDDERMIANSILAGEVSLKDFPNGVGSKACRQALDRLTLIARSAVIFDLPNPALSMGERWPEISVCFQNMESMLGEFCIIDTPGPNEALVNLGPDIVRRLLLNSSAVLCVLHPAALHDENIFKGATDTLEEVRQKQPNSLLVACSRFDEERTFKPENAKKYLANRFSVQDEDVFILSAGKARLSDGVAAYFRKHTTPPEVDFSKVSDVNDWESVFREWGHRMFGESAQEMFPGLTADWIMEKNKRVRESSRIGILQARIHKRIASRAVCVTVLEIVRRIELDVFLPARENINSRIRGVEDSIAQLSEDKQKYVEAQQQTRVSLMCAGVKTERDEAKGRHTLRAVNADISFQASLIKKISTFTAKLQLQIRDQLFREFKKDSEHYSKLGRVDRDSHLLSFKTLRSLKRKMRGISDTMLSLVAGRINRFIPQLSNQLSSSIRDVGASLNADLFGVDADLARSSLNLNGFLDLIFDSNPLHPSKASEKARLKKVKSILNSYEGAGLVVDFDQLALVYQYTIQELMESFIKHILARFVRKVESQRRKFFKLCGCKLDDRAEKINKWDKRLVVSKDAAQEAVILALQTFANIDQASKEIRFWAQHIANVRN